MAVFAYSRVPAFNPNTNPVSLAKSASGSLYDLGDTGFTTPLNLTLVSTNAVTTTLSADANGMFPDFTLVDRTQCVFKSGSLSFVLTTTTPIPGPAGTPGTAGKSVTSAAASAGNLVLTLNDGTSLSPVPLPTGQAIDDSSVGYLVGNGAQTKAALDGRYANASGTTTALNGKVGKGEVAVRVGDYGVAADGTTDDTAKILTAANDAVAKGLPLIFDGSKRYAVAGLVFPATLRVQTFGCTFVKTVNNNTYAIKTLDNFHADTLKLDVTGGASNEAGIYVNGSDTVIDRIKVTALTADQVGTNALLVGDVTLTNPAKSNIRINQITITGFRSPMRVINVTGSRISNATISNFLTGVYVINTTDTTFDKFKVTGTSASSNGTAGQNGLLLESQNADYTSTNLRFRDWLVDGSPEHAYRIGGSYTAADITFEDCIARNPGNAPGNVATGGSGFKVLGTVGHLHYNIRYLNCTTEDGNTSAGGINNHAAYHIGLVDGCTLVNPTLRARNKTYSAQIGMLVFASRNVEVVQPSIRDVNRQSLYILKDSTEPSPPVGVQGLRITGGFFDSLNVNNVIAIDAQSATVRDVFIDNAVVSRGASALRVETPTTVGADVGAVSNVNIKIKYVNAPTGSSTAPITGGNLTVNDYTGPIYGSASIPSLDGGTYLNTGTGARYIRKGGAWVQQ